MTCKTYPHFLFCLSARNSSRNSPFSGLSLQQINLLKPLDSYIYKRHFGSGDFPSQTKRQKSSSFTYIFLPVTFIVASARNSKKKPSVKMYHMPQNNQQLVNFKLFFSVSRFFIFYEFSSINSFRRVKQSKESKELFI